MYALIRNMATLWTHSQLVKRSSRALIGVGWGGSANKPNVFPQYFHEDGN